MVTYRSSNTGCKHNCANTIVFYIESFAGRRRYLAVMDIYCHPTLQRVALSWRYTKGYTPHSTAYLLTWVWPSPDEQQAKIDRKQHQWNSRHAQPLPYSAATSPERLAIDPFVVFSHPPAPDATQFPCNQFLSMDSIRVWSQISLVATICNQTRDIVSTINDLITYLLCISRTFFLIAHSQA